MVLEMTATRVERLQGRRFDDCDIGCMDVGSFLLSDSGGPSRHIPSEGMKRPSSSAADTGLYKEDLDDTAEQEHQYRSP